MIQRSVNTFLDPIAFERCQFHLRTLQRRVVPDELDSVCSPTFIEDSTVDEMAKELFPVKSELASTHARLDGFIPSGAVGSASVRSPLKAAAAEKADSRDKLEKA